jgi:hypothetical protein
MGQDMLKSKLKFEMMQEVVQETGILTWGATCRPYSFVISYGAPGKVYRCSWKNQVFKFAETHYLPTEYENIYEAMAACETQLSRLKGMI